MKKNNMRSPEEKEIIVKRYLSGETAVNLSKEYGFYEKLIYSWINKYQKFGIEGLKSKTGKINSNNGHKGLHLKKPKDKIEELEIELMKKNIEIARLKKGYNVKGVGREKEFVTTFNKNTK